MTTWFFSLQTDTFYSKIKVRLDAVPFFLHTGPPHGKRGLHHANSTTTAFERPPCGGPVLHPAARLRAGGGWREHRRQPCCYRSLNTDNKDDQGLTYTLNAADHTATVANYDNSTPDGVIDIPDTVTSGGQTYTVTAIGEYAFIPSRKITNVSSVFIPATVTSIGRFAFRCCKFLATVTFAEGSQLKSIGVSAFSGTNPAHPRFKEIQIPNSVETIGTNAFQNCQDLESITLPASLKTIESSAFSYCLNLSEIRLPTSLKAIQSYVFDGCSSLETVFYDGSLAQWSRINTSNGFLGYSSPSLVMGDYTAQFIPVKDENDPDPPPKTVTITKYTGTESTVILPSTINSWPVTKIGEDAFQDNTTITSVTIPANVTEIGSNAFAGCTNLTSVNYGGDWSNLTIQSGNPAVEDAAKDAANEQLFDFEFTPDNTAVIVNNYKCKGHWLRMSPSPAATKANPSRRLTMLLSRTPLLPVLLFQILSLRFPMLLL